MSDRLLVGVLGHRNSGKSHTWNALFDRTVRRGANPRALELRPGESVEVFLVSGSFEEREEYAGDILKSQDCRIVLCSMQYAEEVGETLAYFMDQGFSLYVQWLNPCYSDQAATFDHLGLAPRILAARSVLAIRNGQVNADFRVQEIREFIYGWARYRNLIFATATT
jgi:hypothetical protein